MYHSQILWDTDARKAAVQDSVTILRIQRRGGPCNCGAGPGYYSGEGGPHVASRRWGPGSDEVHEDRAKYFNPVRPSKGIFIFKKECQMIVSLFLYFIRLRKFQEHREQKIKHLFLR